VISTASEWNFPGCSSSGAWQEMPARIPALNDYCSIGALYPDTRFTRHLRLPRINQMGRRSQCQHSRHLWTWAEASHQRLGPGAADERAGGRFISEEEEFHDRHEMSSHPSSAGKFRLDEYLGQTVFYRAAPLQRESLPRLHVFALAALPDVLNFARSLAGLEPVFHGHNQQ